MTKQIDKVEKTEATATVILPPAKSVAKFLEIDANNNVSLKKGYTLGVNGLAVFAAEKIDSGASAYTIAANTLRAARALPKVGEREAFNVACEAVLPLLKAASSFRNVQFLISALDAKDALNLECSPYDVALSLGYLKKAGIVDDSGDKLKLTDADAAKADPVFAALKTGSAKSNGLRDVIKTAKVAKNDAAKAANLPPVFHMGGKPKAGTVDSSKTVQDRATGEEKPASGIEKLSAGIVDGLIEAVIRDWDKAVAEGVAVADLRAKCGANVKALAKLAGFVVKAVVS